MLDISYPYLTFSLFRSVTMISYPVCCIDRAHFSKGNLYHTSVSLFSWLNRLDCCFVIDVSVSLFSQQPAKKNCHARVVSENKN